MASTFVVKLLLFLAISFSNSLHILFAMSASPNLSFSLTHRDADNSPLRSVEADPADLPEDMPMRAFVAAGRALRTRLSMKREQQLILKAKGVAPRLLGRRISFGESLVGDFFMTVSVGTPSQKMIWLLDTGSELSWLESSPCSTCSGTTAPRFAYKKSSSFHAVNCQSSLCHSSVGLTQVPGCNFTATAPAHSCFFGVGYLDGSGDYGFVSVDTFDLGPRLSKPFVFGSAVIVKDAVNASSYSGLLGLDAGPYSFTSQLFSGSSRGMPKKFAYWVPDRLKSSNANTGRIEFGNYKKPRGMRYTPLAPPFSPLGASYYYVSLQGITVGKSLIKADTRGPNDILEGGGGTIFDSGAALSHLILPLYGKLVDEMMRQSAHLRPFRASNTTLESDLCYKRPAQTETLPNVPRIIIHFARGVDLQLEPNSVLYGDLLPGDNANIYFCLAFRSSLDNENIIGNYQGQNYWVEYNLDTSSLGLAKATSAHL